MFRTPHLALSITRVLVRRGCWLRRTARLAIGWVLLTGLVGAARAQSTEAPPLVVPDPPSEKKPRQDRLGASVSARPAALPVARRRVFGAGVGMGVGIGGAKSPVESKGKWLVPLRYGNMLPLELQFFTRRGHSVDVTVPLGETLYSGAVGGMFHFNTDVFYDFNIGRGRVRGLLGPGLGVSVVGAAQSLFLVEGRILALLGVELLNRDETFGFRLMLRPWAAFGHASLAGTTGRGFNAGGMFVIGGSWYATR